MNLADMTILDGVPSASGRAPDVELNIYKNDADQFEAFEFITRDGSGLGNNPSIVLPISQIDNVIAMLQKIKNQQAA